MKKSWSILLILVLLLFSMETLALAKNIDLQAVLGNTAAEGKFDVYHWWTAGGEKEAVDSAIAAFNQRYPNISVISNAIPGGAGGSMVMKVKVLALTGNSPETFQAHPGLELEPYEEAAMLYDLTELWETLNLEDRMLNGISELCQIDGKYYIVPIGVHKTNMVFYNKKMFEEYDINPPQEPVSWDDFWELCDELQAKLPADKFPIDLGDRKGWPATQVFESVMMGTSPQTYEDFINGVATIEQVTEVLENMKRLMGYVAPDHSARLWYEAAGRVVAGDYAMMVHGSWIQAFFTSQGWEYGKDYGAFAAPGTSDTFGFCIDAFVVPNGSTGVENGLRWAAMIADQNLQTVFTGAKESVSPYRDVPEDIYDDLTLKFKSELLDDKTLVYPSFTHGTALPWQVSTDLHSRISDFATSSDPDPERYARMITQSIKEAAVKGEWNIVQD